MIITGVCDLRFSYCIALCYLRFDNFSFYCAVAICVLPSSGLESRSGGSLPESPCGCAAGQWGAAFHLRLGLRPHALPRPHRDPAGNSYFFPVDLLAIPLFSSSILKRLKFSLHISGPFRRFAHWRHRHFLGGHDCLGDCSSGHANQGSSCQI